ncbi:MAG: ClbS/DfsB family four-helix bundle protein [Caldilineaceae bacterium]|nr:ClbS/DfsB family four-helix bundle protein [Caldilineaceae bacterium]
MALATDKSTLLERANAGWSRLQRALEMLTEKEMTEFQIDGNWTVKDILAHIAFWEDRLLLRVSDALAGRPVERQPGGLSEAAVDTLNEENYRAHADLDLHTVLGKSAEIHNSLMDALMRLPEDPLDDFYTVWWGGEPPWAILAGDSYAHYEEHLTAIEAYLERRDKPGSQNAKGEV